MNTADGFSELARVWCQSWVVLIFVGESRGILGLLERSNEEEGLEGGKAKKDESSMGNDKVANAPTATHLGPLPLGRGVKAHFQLRWVCVRETEKKRKKEKKENLFTFSSRNHCPQNQRYTHALRSRRRKRRSIDLISIMDRIHFTVFQRFRVDIALAGNLQERKIRGSQ